MAAKKKVMKEKVDLQTLTQQVVEKSHQLGVTGYEYHHNGVEMTLTGLNKVLNGTTKKTNLNNLRQMQQYLAENYENGPSVVKENQQQYAKISSEEKSLLQRLKIIEDKVDKSMHVGRHTFATNYILRNGNVKNLQVLLGHKKIETTMVYVHISNRSAAMTTFIMD